MQDSKASSVLRLVFDNGSPDTFILSLASSVSARQGPRELTAWRGASTVEAGDFYDILTGCQVGYRTTTRASWYRMS